MPLFGHHSRSILFDLDPGLFQIWASAASSSHRPLSWREPGHPADVAQTRGVLVPYVRIREELNDARPRPEATA